MKVEILVCDSAPIIKGVNIESIAEHAITVPGVIRELKDLKTRQRMRNLPPYFFSIKEPSRESVSHVIRAAKETGDIKVLSKVDIEVIALSYEIKAKQHAVEELFKEMAVEEKELSTKDTNNEVVNHFLGEAESEIMSVTTDDYTSVKSELDGESDGELDIEIIEEEEEEEESHIDQEITDLEDGWVTKKNQHLSLAKINSYNSSTVKVKDMEVKPTVACLTSDFALQNVLRKLDISISSFDGMIITELRNFVSRCRSCFKVFKKTDIFFCPHCGNNSLGRVPAKIENGELKLFLKKGFKPNLRNTKFSIPKPQSGKHTDGRTYVYCADQRLPHERAKKVKNPNEEEFFSFYNDVSSKSAVLGIRGIRNDVLKPTVPRGNKKSRGSKRRK